MKTGNKIQALVLGVVAVLAIAFLVYQLMPSQSKPLLGSATRTASTAQGPSASQELSLAVLGNPFSHPMLAAKPIKQDAKQPPSQIDKAGMFSPVRPKLPGVNGDASQPAPDYAAKDASPNLPADNAGNNRSKVQGPRIQLTAIMRVGEPVAMLAIDDQTGKAFSEGDLLAPNARLIKIRDSSVTVRVNGVEHEIATGDSYGAPEDKTK